MKDYTLNKNEKEKYIKTIRKSKKNGVSTYEVTFADGRKFKNITCSDENLDKIVAVQENQANQALQNSAEFIKKEKNYKLTTIVGTIATGLIAGAPAFNLISGNSYETLPLAIGAVTLTTTFASLIKFAKARGKVVELSKLNYRNRNMNELAKYKEYENSLTGLSRSTKKHFEKEEKPFSIIEINKFKEKDLKTIMSNIEREKTYKFSYNESQNKTK